eukprot:scaffold3221_cov194-Amphora_coffeaeformis.AAC.7
MLVAGAEKERRIGDDVNNRVNEDDDDDDDDDGSVNVRLLLLLLAVVTHLRATSQQDNVDVDFMLMVCGRVGWGGMVWYGMVGYTGEVLMEYIIYSRSMVPKRERETR